MTEFAFIHLSKRENINHGDARQVTGQQSGQKVDFGDICIPTCRNGARLFARIPLHRNEGTRGKLPTTLLRPRALATAAYFAQIDTMYVAGRCMLHDH